MTLLSPWAIAHAVADAVSVAVRTRSLTAGITRLADALHAEVILAREVERMERDAQR